MKKLNANYRFITGDINSDSIVVDVGGHHGNWATKIFNRFKCKVFIFEPAENNIKILKNRIKNNNIIIIPKAVSDKTGTKKLFLSKKDDSHSLFRTSETVKEVIVKTITISKFIYEYKINKINCLKINAEGAEYNIIRSLTDNIVSKIDVISFDLHRKLFTKRRIKKIFYILKKHNYMVEENDFMRKRGFIGVNYTAWMAK